jgi:site-specific recombinase XerD
VTERNGSAQRGSERFGCASGVDLEVVQGQFDHTNIKTTTVYAKITKEDKLRAANDLA